jgi:hypothetical protein
MVLLVHIQKLKGERILVNADTAYFPAVFGYNTYDKKLFEPSTVEREVAARVLYCLA